MVPVGWKLHTDFHTCPHTLSYNADSSVVREPDPQWLLPFPSPKEGKHAAMYVCFSIFSPPFLFISIESQPLALMLPHSFLLSLAPVRMEPDGSWRDGGIVLTVKLMWPRGCCPCNTWPDSTECKVLHCKMRVGEKRTRRTQLCMEVDWEMQKSRGVFTRRTGGSLHKKASTGPGNNLKYDTFRGFMIIHK